jgi:hypothetical protein
MAAGKKPDLTSDFLTGMGGGRDLDGANSSRAGETDHGSPRLRVAVGIVEGRATAPLNAPVERPPKRAARPILAKREAS